MASLATQSWAKVDASVYTCFTDQGISSENWCEQCQSLGHVSKQCPLKPQKQPWSMAQAIMLEVQ